MSIMVTKTHEDGSEELVVEYRAHGITVPRGFHWDGASAPRFLWTIIPPMYRTKRASCIHDYLCRNAKGPADRKVADKLFYKMLGEAGLNKVRCTLGYIGVRLGAKLGIGIYY